MAINFIVNDPMAGAHSKPRRQPARDDRPANRAGFVYSDAAEEAVYPVGTPEFLFWQCSEAALAAVETWERLDVDLEFWAGNRRNLELLQDAGNGLNATYDRQRLSFYSHTQAGKTTQTAASTDVVAHEAGHAFADAVRPDLWHSVYPEVAAFHEAFGDCVALLTALDDRQVRESLLREAPFLWNANFVERTAEDLADGILQAFGPGHPASQPRRALNWHQWQLPSTLPYSGPPQTLTSEPHSFGQVFTGCFYDLLANIFGAGKRHTQSALQQAAHTAGRLLTAALRAAPDTARFFQAMGRSMVLADSHLNGGANHEAIHDAFAWHNVSLGSAAMLAPIATLEGAAPAASVRGAKPALARATQKDLRQRLGAEPGARLQLSRVEIGGESVVQAVHHRHVNLGDIDPRLSGVVAIAAEPVLVGQSGRRAAALGALPDATATRDEVATFVTGLLQNNCVRLSGAAPDAGRVRRIRPQARREPLTGAPTHCVQTVAGKKMLRRDCTHCVIHAVPATAPCVQPETRRAQPRPSPPEG